MHRLWVFFCLLSILRTTAQSACRDCAAAGLGGPGDNRFTAYDAICRGDLCRDTGFPQVSVNLSNLTLYIRVTDLAFGGPSPAFSFERSYNQDDTSSGPFGTGWSFNLGDSLTADTDGSQVLHRGSGRIDRYAAAVPPASASGGYFALTTTTDTLVRNSDGTFTLRGAGSTTTQLFGADGRLQAIQDSGTARVSLDYDNAGRITAAHYRGRLLQFAYGGGGRISSVTDSAGRTVSYSYTDDGHLSQQTNADGQTVTYQYDDSGNLTSVGTTAITYNSDGSFTSVASITTAEGAVRKYDIPLNPTQIRLTKGKGNATLYVSSAVGLLLSVTDANGNTVSYSYDAAGRRTATTNGAGETAKFSYDSAGNLTGITDNAGNRWSADYSNAGPAHITDPNGNVWNFTYDGAGNLTGVANPKSGGFSATRSAAGQITSLTDGLGNKSSYQYSSDGLLATFIDALTGTWVYQYDGAARVSTRTDPGGTALSADYSASNRITALGADDVKSSFDYSGLHRDGQNRLVSYTDSFGNQLTYQYDAAGQLTALTLPGSKTVTYQYDRVHRLSMVSDWAGNFAVYRYDAAGWPVSVTVSGGPVTVYQYDAAHRLRVLVSTGPDGLPVAGYRYTLDANGNRTAVSALEPSTGRYTLAANSLTFSPANLPVSRSDGQTYQYDARGNLMSIQGPRAVTLGYDAFGRLLTFNADSSTSYTYDSTGLRVVRATNGADRRFVYDPSGVQPRVVMEADSSNAPIAWYIYGLGLLWKLTADGTSYFYHFDGDGNTVALSTTASGVVNRYRYDPSGLLVAVTEGVENMFRAHGEAGWTDDGNGLVFNGRAYLFPELRLTLPAAADPSPPAPKLVPQFPGAGACFVEGVASCLFATGRRER
ncbi:MAG TPA: DUF6531 domain-containing protein [Bryobacteraceae bacterium]|nr:DUF6531 domain-containing protein [Bryobacteraceae bacterium]